LCILLCREVWDDTGRVISTTEASASGLQQQELSQCTVAVTSTLQHICRSSPSQQNGALLKPASMQQSSSTVPTSSLPSLASSQADRSAGLLTQLQQLVESCRLPDQASSDLMNWFSQELHGILHTPSPSLQQVCSHTDSIHVSSSGDGAIASTDASEAMPNNSGALPAASVVTAEVPGTLCSQDSFHPNAAAASADVATNHLATDHQYARAEVHSDSFDQLSLRTHLEQLQQMYLESAASALRSLYVLQQQVVPATSSTIVDSASALSSRSTTARTFEDPAHSQSSDHIPRSD